MSILLLLRQTGDLYVPTIGADGLPGYSATASAAGVRCRIDESHKQVQRSDGTTVITDAVIFVPAGTTVTVGYKFISGSDSYFIESVTPVRALTAVSHYELLARKL